jgi:hypothetical protein
MPQRANGEALCLIEPLKAEPLMAAGVAAR